MYYISMDLTRQALQTNGKVFFEFLNHFSNRLQFFKIIVPFFYASEVGEAFDT